MAELVKWIYKIVYEETVAADASFETDWTADADYIIDKIHIIEKTGRTLYKTPVTMRIEEEVITKDKVPASLFAPDEWLSPKLNAEFPKGKTYFISGTNKEGVSIDIAVILKLVKK